MRFHPLCFLLCEKVYSRQMSTLLALDSMRSLTKLAFFCVFVNRTIHFLTISVNKWQKIMKMLTFFLVFSFFDNKFRKNVVKMDKFV